MRAAALKNLREAVRALACESRNRRCAFTLRLYTYVCVFLDPPSSPPAIWFWSSSFGSVVCVCVCGNSAHSVFPRRATVWLLLSMTSSHMYMHTYIIALVAINCAKQKQPKTANIYRFFTLSLSLSLSIQNKRCIVLWLVACPKSATSENTVWRRFARDTTTDKMRPFR